MATDWIGLDDVVINEFAQVLKAKIAQARAEGLGELWSATNEDLSVMLHNKVDAGDPCEVAIIAMIHWHKRTNILPAPWRSSAKIVATGKMTKLVNVPDAGGQLTLTMDGRSIQIEGLSDEMTRACKPLLYERVDVELRAADTSGATAAVNTIPVPISRESLEWMPAARAAFHIGVDLKTIKAWATSNQIQHRTDQCGLAVECTSLLVRSHRYWRERTGS
ncbi:hypothetical protein [Burkholderia plantarii]|uniref:hypothetical protein n=1 Tax=Burkholderia plantarii TaxID=41899 RepID=UPI0018DCD77E|nr:hypothetical protein [Burkholderia plantarii]MBI0331712.1 hypothetical protein [Burkholderia plantarii]